MLILAHQAGSDELGQPGGVLVALLLDGALRGSIKTTGEGNKAGGGDKP